MVQGTFPNAGARSAPLLGRARDDRYAQRVDVSVRRESDGRFLVKLATDEQEVNVRLSAVDLRALVGSGHWSEPGIMQAGESAGVPVFWASDGNQARLLIGHDDQTRADAITVPFTAVDEIVRGALRGHP